MWTSTSAGGFRNSAINSLTTIASPDRRMRGGRRLLGLPWTRTSISCGPQGQQPRLRTWALIVTHARTTSGVFCRSGCVCEFVGFPHGAHLICKALRRTREKHSDRAHPNQSGTDPDHFFRWLRLTHTLGSGWKLRVRRHRLAGRNGSRTRGRRYGLSERGNVWSIIKTRVHNFLRVGRASTKQGHSQPRNHHLHSHRFFESHCVSLPLNLVFSRTEEIKANGMPIPSIAPQELQSSAITTKTSRLCLGRHR